MSNPVLCGFCFVHIDARIDSTTLQLIGDNEITSLFGPIGDRLRFKTNLDLWKKELSTADTEARSAALLTPTVSRNIMNLLCLQSFCEEI